MHFSLKLKALISKRQGQRNLHSAQDHFHVLSRERSDSRQQAQAKVMIDTSKQEARHNKTNGSARTTALDQDKNAKIIISIRYVELGTGGIQFSFRLVEFNCISVGSSFKTVTLSGKYCMDKQRSNDSIITSFYCRHHGYKRHSHTPSTFRTYR